tara:strand:- start:169 stop:534 length:366 start_codon:yes stop_codon:yes gene_type:complete
MEEIKDTSLIELLECGHYYHIQCTNKFVRNKKSCPLCNKQINENERRMCSICSDGTLEHTYTGSVLPYDLRELVYNSDIRHETDGVYGIGEYDLEELILKTAKLYIIGKKLYLRLDVHSFE